LSFDVTLVQAIKHKTEVRGRLKVVLYDNDEIVGILSEYRALLMYLALPRVLKLR